MIILHVYYELFEGQRDAFMKVLDEYQIPQKSKAEVGNHAYDYYFPVGEDNQLFLLEKWENEECFEAHKRSEHFLKLQELKKDYIKSAKLDIFPIKNA
ncbi:MAG TPA: hypothetical protein DIC19_03110 [Erysipelotrichaceae bacterium]|nr:hypothetical protein [Erysipelotrichaceae bacterium]